MTTTYDPSHPRYLDEADVRGELDRVFDLCHGCRLCFKFCSAFPTLFRFVDAIPDQDASHLTADQQNQVIGECFQCKLCHVNCPYIPGQHEWELDFPRLMLRASAMRKVTSPAPVVRRLVDDFPARTDLVGRLASGPQAPAVNAALAQPGSPVRAFLARTAGLSSQRLLPPFARQRFTTWFRRRTAPVPPGGPQGRVAVYPTCLVEYQATGIGQDLVKVYEHNGVECSLAGTTACCGAPWLHDGNLEQFRRVARENVGRLAESVRSGRDIVVPQPTCAYVLKKDYPAYVDSPDAHLVAEHTYDAAEYLMRLHKGEGTHLDTNFPGPVPDTVAYHTPCHLRAQNIGLKSRDLLKLAGARIKLLQQCSGIDGMWGLRAGNEPYSLPVAAKLAEGVRAADCAVVAGDCHLANGAITEQTGIVPRHPIQIVARAYGLPEEPS